MILSSVFESFMHYIVTWLMYENHLELSHAKNVWISFSLVHCDLHLPRLCSITFEPAHSISPSVAHQFERG